LTKLLASDPSIPAGRVVAAHSTILTDAAAAPFPSAASSDR
jgi:hypothetical protein